MMGWNEAMDQAVEVMARAGNFSSEPFLDTDTEETWYARVMLTALLEAQNETCATCGGDEGEAIRWVRDDGVQESNWVPCRDCNGSGRVPGTPLVLLAPRQVGWENEAKLLRDAIHDIDEHATPLAEDEDGFVATGYAVSVGCLHRAINLMHQDFSGERTGVGEPLYAAQTEEKQT